MNDWSDGNGWGSHQGQFSLEPASIVGGGGGGGGGRKKGTGSKKEGNSNSYLYSRLGDGGGCAA